MTWDNAFSQQMLELALTDEAFEEFHRERSIKQAKVTKEEIALLTIEEDLTLFERICHMFRNGQEIQIIFALQHITDFLQSLSARERSVVMTLVKELLINGTSSKSMMTTAGQSVSSSIELGFLGRDGFIANFFQYTVESLKCNDKEIVESWLLSLIASLKILMPKDIEQVLNFLNDSVSLSQYTTTRKSCCKIVSHLAQVLPEHRIKNCLMPKLKALCQDIELDIRSCMCTELEYMVKFTTDDVIEEYIIPELLLLFEDEETSVRRICFETITNILPQIRRSFLERSDIKDHVIKFYELTISKKQADNMILAAQFIGKFLYHLKSVLREKEISFFVEKFVCLCGYGVADASSSFCINNKLLSFSSQSMMSSSSHSSQHDKFAECRYWCAYNFPAITSMIEQREFKLHLHPCFVLLVKDSHPLVRKTIALCFHEITALIPTDVPLLTNSLKTILKDPDLEIVDSLLTHLPETLDCFKNEKISQFHVAELLPTLLACEQEISKSLRWRTHEKFLHSVSCFHKHLSSDQIYYKLVPLVTDILISNRVRPVKLAAARTLLTFVKHNINVDERNEICHKITHEFAESPCSRSRILYIDICYDIVEMFSKSFFKEYFYDSLMILAVDPEVNVRLKFCKALPLLKSQIKLPSDRLLLQMLEQTVRRIMALESDNEVSSTIRSIILELDSIRLPMDGTPLNQDDLIDREREMQEDKVVENSLQIKHEEHGRSMSLSEKCADKAPPKRNRKSGSFSGGTIIKEVSKKVPSKGSLTNSTVNSPKKAGSMAKSKEVSPTKSGASISKLTTKKSSSHTTKRTK